MEAQESLASIQIPKILMINGHLATTNGIQQIKTVFKLVSSTKYFNIEKMNKFLCLKKEVLWKQEVSTIAQWKKRPSILWSLACCCDVDRMQLPTIKCANFTFALKNTVLLRTAYFLVHEKSNHVVGCLISLSISSRGQLGNHFNNWDTDTHKWLIQLDNDILLLAIVFLSITLNHIFANSLDLFVHLECVHKGLYPLKFKALALGGHGPTWQE